MYFCKMNKDIKNKNRESVILSDKAFKALVKKTKDTKRSKLFILNEIIERELGSKII